MRGRNYRIAVLLALLLALLLSACQYVEPLRLGLPGESRGVLRGSGAVVERRIPLESGAESYRLRLSGISLRWAGEQAQSQRDAEDLVINEAFAREIKLSTDDNIAEWIKISCDAEGVIVITMEEKKILAPTALRITVGAPVEELILDGAWNFVYNCPGVRACSVRLGGASKGDFTFGSLDRLGCTLNGACDITLRGAAARADFTINGASHIAAFDLLAGDAGVTINGAGSCEITAAGALDAEVNGVGQVVYGGSPLVRRTIHGLGEVKAR